MSAHDETTDRRRIAIAIAIAGSAVWAAWHAGVSPGRVASAGSADGVADLLAGLARPDLSAPFLRRISALALESLLIGVLGTAIALVIGTALALAAARPLELDDDPLARPWPRCARAAVRAGARAVLAVFRSVPEILWAFLFVRIFGLGPGPAVLAIGITFGGIIGKLFAELVEAADPAPARLLRAAGAGPLAVLAYAVLPQVRGQWTAYALFRLECAIRSASILGVVGAGGLGSEIDLAIRYAQYDKLATALLAVLAFVIAIELAGAALRRAHPAWLAALFGGGALAGLVGLDIPWADLAGTHELRQAAAFAAGFADPTTDGAFLARALELALITVAMAWCATCIAGALAFALAPLSSASFAVRGYLADAPRGRGISRWLAAGALATTRLALQLMRALPDLVWALLFIVWLGPGVTAGVLALTVHTAGVLGRLYGDALEDVDPAPPRAIEATGAGAAARYLYGVLPQALPRMLAFTLFQFEVNIRAAAMVGFVGAGGLGDALHTAISLFHMRDLAALLAVMIAVVIAIDALGDRVRVRLLR